MSTIKQASTYKFREGQMLLLDANVLIFRSGATDNPRKERLYTKVLENIKSAECQAIVDTLVISEFVNRYSRLEGNKMKETNQSFKNFRDSKNFQPIAQDVSIWLEKIFEYAEIVPSEFSMENVASIIEEFAKGKSDFNDQIIVEICKKYGAILITEDRDFAGKGIPILTENTRMLSSSLGTQ